MTLLDVVDFTEPTPKQAELLTQPFTGEDITQIAEASSLPANQVEKAFLKLQQQLNVEEEHETNLADQLSPFQIITPTDRQETIHSRVQNHDQPNLKFLLDSLRFFSQNKQPGSALEPPNPIDLHEGLETLRLHNAIYLHSPTSTLLARLTWYVAALNNQWLYSDKSASQMQSEVVTRFRDMGQAIFNPDLGVNTEANQIYTDQDYVAKMLRETLHVLQQPTSPNTEAALSSHPRVLIVGPGNGKVESEILAQFNLPKEMIDAVDFLSSANIGPMWEGMNFIGETDFLDWASKSNNHNKYDLVMCVGSTLVNHEDYLKHLEYALATQSLLKEGGIYCYETRLLEAGIHHNTARARSQEFARTHPLRPPGSAPSAHTLPHFDPAGFGAAMQPWQLQRLVFDLVGLSSLNYPLGDPASEDRFFDNLRENEFILSQLRHADPATHNALAEPVWLANTGNYRIAHFVQKTPRFDTTIAQLVIREYSRALKHPRRLSQKSLPI